MESQRKEEESDTRGVVLKNNTTRLVLILSSWIQSKYPTYTTLLFLVAVTIIIINIVLFFGDEEFSGQTKHTTLVINTNILKPYDHI